MPSDSVCIQKQVYSVANEPITTEKSNLIDNNYKKDLNYFV